jgi:ketosteroid isomerase-like protein
VTGDNAVRESTRKAVDELYAAYDKRDFKRVAALIDDDVDWIIYLDHLWTIHIFPFVG